MIKISISKELKDKCPDLVLGEIFCEVENTEFNEGLWEEINKVTLEIRNNLTFEKIKDQPVIKATRVAYKKTGKDPNRYRPSSESLCRRIVKGNDLYQINTLVDLINLVSLKYGYSIGGFDVDKIQGDVVLGIGKKDEPYEGIGRGKLNIEGLPVQRDNIGGIGTPTSDEIRTAIDINTKRFYMNINGYNGQNGLSEAMEYSIDLLKKYLNAKLIETTIIK
jgi:DNA/RNA-binding domain of Phe-tRNA-synthetase-like protein